MLFINDKKIEQNPAAVDGLTAKQQKTALAFIQGAVCTWCNLVHDEYEYCATELVGGDISNWEGTPLQCIYEVCKKRCEGNDEKAKELAEQVFEQLLTTCLMNDKRRFDLTEADEEYDALYYWSDDCDIKTIVRKLATGDNKEKLRLIMSVLLNSVKKRETLGYKVVQKRVEEENSYLGGKMQFHLVLPDLLGDLNRAIRRKCKKAPTITAIVINQLKKVPGADIEGFPGFKNYRKADDAKKMKKATKHQNKVYDYGYSEWKKIYTELFG